MCYYIYYIDLDYYSIVSNVIHSCINAYAPWTIERITMYITITPIHTTTSTYRPVVIFVNGKLEWDKLHLMISRSTTPDLIKVITKLDEFVRKQVGM